jgi:hypothetical protein
MLCGQSNPALEQPVTSSLIGSAPAAAAQPASTGMHCLVVAGDATQQQQQQQQ